jgi:hypothetical protein
MLNFIEYWTGDRLISDNITQLMDANIIFKHSLSTKYIACVTDLYKLQIFVESHDKIQTEVSCNYVGYSIKHGKWI